MGGICLVMLSHHPIHLDWEEEGGGIVYTSMAVARRGRNQWLAGRWDVYVLAREMMLQVE
jgi:hypothetical protein